MHKKFPLNRLVGALAAASALSAAAPLALAESVQVPVGQQAKQKWELKRPHNGMKQSQVEAVFGQPLDWRNAVGDPPISSWIYAEFVVYFEYDEVIHTVLTPADQSVAQSGS